MYESFLFEAEREEKYYVNHSYLNPNVKFLKENLAPDEQKAALRKKEILTYGN